MHAPPPTPTTTVLNPWLEPRLELADPSGRVLDLGCGDGFWLSRLRARTLDPVGVEPAVAWAVDAARHGPAVAAEAERLPVADGTFAAGWSVHVLHHLADVAAALAEVHRVLRPGGVLLLAETVDDSPLMRWGRDVVPRWDAAPVRSRFRRAQLLEALAGVGLVVEDDRHYGMVSFAAWLLPRRQVATWRALSAVEERAPAALRRFGAHVELVARRDGRHEAAV